MEGWRISVRKLAPYGAMVLAQLIAASYTILSKIIFTEGTSTVVFMVYQFIAAFAFMSPFAYFVERKARPPVTLATLFQNLFAASLNYISSTAQSAILNLFPAFTYLLSVATRQEMPELKRLRGIGKLSGTILSVVGALTMVFWNSSAVLAAAAAGSGHSMVGYVFATLGILSLSTWLVLQEPMARRYPAELSTTTMMYFFGTLQTCVIAAFTSTKASEWKLKWDLELLNIFFGGVLNSGIGIFIFAWCARVKGPLFVAVFAPLTLLFTAVAEILFLGQSMSIGSVVGSLLIVGGLYLFLWAKSEEEVDDPKTGKDELTSPLISSEDII
ncbi:hypothetical protein ACLOJK_011877 [Asimina triloba]